MTSGGYVGLSIATLLSQHHKVMAVDIVPEKVELINNKKSPIQDEYIEKYLAEKELDLCHALLYSYLCIVMLHVAVLAYVDPSTKKMKRVEKAFEKEKQNQLNSIDKRLYKILVVFGMEHP